MSHILFWLIFNTPTIGLFLFVSSFLGSPTATKSEESLIKSGSIIKSASIPSPPINKFGFIFKGSLKPHLANSSRVILLNGEVNLFTSNNFWNVDTLY